MRDGARFAAVITAAAWVAGCASDPVCVLEIEPLGISEGGRVTISRDGNLADPGWSASASAGLVATVEAAAIALRSDYGVTAGELVLSRAGCEDVAVPVEVRPLALEVASQWDPAEAGPPGREYGAWWVGERAGRRGVFVYGGFQYYPVQFTPSADLWFYDIDAETWASIETEDAPLVPGARVAPGPEDGTVLLFGGGESQEDGSLDTAPSLQQLRYDGTDDRWSAAPFAEGSPGSYTGAFLFDRARARWLSVCGADARVLGLHCTVSAYTPEDGWSQLEVAGTTPPGRMGFHYALDEETDRVIIVGGHAGSADTDIIGDTWALELGETPPRWVQLFESSDDVKRRNGAFVLDPLGHRLILFGGTPDGRSAVPGLSILRLDRGEERWDHVAVPGVPPRASGYAVFDAESARAFMGMGNAGAVYTDLYSLSL